MLLILVVYLVSGELVVLLFFFLMIRRPPRSTLDRSSAASDVYKRQTLAFAMIPVWSEFFIETDYLPQKFTYSNTAARWVRISDAVTELSLIHISEPTRPY